MATVLQDADSNTFSQLEVTLCGIKDGDSEVLVSSYSNRVIARTDANGTCRFKLFRSRGNSNTTDYNNLLTSFTYRNTQDEPLPGLRTVTFQVMDADNGSTLFSGAMASNRAISEVTVETVNDHRPIFSQTEYTAQIDEELSIGSSIGVTLQANDGDRYGSDRLAFSLVPSVDSAHFSVNASTGDITIKQRVNYEGMPPLSQLVFNVSVEDHPNDPTISLSSTAIVRVTVNDINDNTPAILTPDALVANVNEDSIVDSFVMEVMATDADSGSNGAIQYSINEGMAVPFIINTTSGEITVAQGLDFDTGAQDYNFTVTAQDLGQPARSSTAHVLVNLVDVNDNTPQFDLAEYEVIIPESTVAGSSILQVTVTDDDSGSNGEVDLTLDDDSVFEIVSNGTLRLKQELDYDTLTDTNITLSLTAKDRGPTPLSAVVTILVSVEDVNDNSPVFSSSQYTAQFREDAPIGYVVERLSAMDNDTNDQLTFTLLSAGPFALNRSTGVLTVASALDYEQQQSYRLTASVSDGLHSSTASVIIAITDVNDNSPIFNTQQTAFFVREDASPSFVVANLSATDVDSGANARLVYRIASGNVGKAFSVDLDGILRPAMNLDRETLSEYQLTVVVEDTGTPTLNNSVTVKITVLDANDNPPMLNPSSTKFAYTEGSPSIPIAVGLSVDDADADLMQSATIRLEAPSCQLTPEQLDQSCGSNATCQSACGEMLEVTPPSDTIALKSTSLFVWSLTGAASTSVYSAALRTLRYSSRAVEPAAGDRRVVVTVSDGVQESSPLVITISMQLLNEHRPIITAQKTNFSFDEGSTPMQIGLSAGIRVTDEDASTDSLIHSLNISLLDSPDGFSESIAVQTNRSDSIDVLESTIGQKLTLRGIATVENYTDVLKSLQYVNTAEEPTTGQRRIQLIASDSQNSSRSLILRVDVVAVDDNPTEFSVGQSQVQYTEGSGDIDLTSLAGLQIVDQDETNSDVTITGPLDVAVSGGEDQRLSAAAQIPGVSTESESLT